MNVWNTSPQLIKIIQQYFTPVSFNRRTFPSLFTLNAREFCPILCYFSNSFGLFDNNVLTTPNNKLNSISILSFASVVPQFNCFAIFFTVFLTSACSIEFFLPFPISCLLLKCYCFFASFIIFISRLFLLIAITIYSVLLPFTEQVSICFWLVLNYFVVPNCSFYICRTCSLCK